MESHVFTNRATCERYVHLFPECIFEHAQKTDAPELTTIVEVMFSHFVAEHNLPAAIAGSCCSLAHRIFPDSIIAKAMTCRQGRQRWYWRVVSPWRGLSLLSPKGSTRSSSCLRPRREYGPQQWHAPHRSRTANINKVCAGLEFDGGTAAICRRAVPTGRNALWMKQ